MIVERAFYGLPELWVGGSAVRFGERHLAADFKRLIEEQAGLRGIGLTVSLEEHYDINRTDGRGPRLAADLRTHWPGAGSAGSLGRQYVIQENAWLEIKYRRQTDGVGGLTLPASEAKRIKRDLIRLCVLVGELQGDIRCNARYFCAVFYGTPHQMDEQTSHPCRIDEPWLQQLFTPGLGSNVRVTYPDVGESRACIDLTLDKTTYAFAPPPGADQSSWFCWGYLVRIHSFSASLTRSDSVSGVVRMEYREPDGPWSQEHALAQQEIGNLVVRGCDCAEEACDPASRPA